MDVSACKEGKRIPVGLLVAGLIFQWIFQLFRGLASGAVRIRVLVPCHSLVSSEERALCLPHQSPNPALTKAKNPVLLLHETSSGFARPNVPAHGTAQVPQSPDTCQVPC